MPSAVAGIVDARGGFRVVVSDVGFDAHLEKGERLFVVPGFTVEEPVPWDDIPSVIHKVQKHIVKTLAPVNHCGECLACCYQLYIDDPQLKKPSRSWCLDCTAGLGCRIYFRRPQSCRKFKCEWLASQERNDAMPAHLRPDRCGAIFTSHPTDPLIIECHGTPDKHAWAWINEMQRLGYKVKEITRYHGEG